MLQYFLCFHVVNIPSILVSINYLGCVGYLRCKWLNIAKLRTGGGNQSSVAYKKSRIVALFTSLTKECHGILIYPDCFIIFSVFDKFFNSYLCIYFIACVIYVINKFHMATVI